MTYMKTKSQKVTESARNALYAYIQANTNRAISANYSRPHGPSASVNNHVHSFP